MQGIATSRRDFLKGGGALVVGFSLAGQFGPAFAQAAAIVAKTVAPDQVDGFLAIGADGTVTVYSGKVDLGTGVQTALSQMAAEELSVPLAKVTLIQGDTALTPDQGPTYGSLSIQNGGVQIRHAAATARRALLDMAAQRLGVPAADLAVRDGTIAPKTGGEGVTYAELVGGKTLSLAVDKEAPLKPVAEYTVVGRSVPRLDIPAKVFGQFTYMQDFGLPGMLHGRVVRPPAIGATLESVDEGSVADIPGIVRVVRDGSFLAVVAETEWAAIRGAEKLRAGWSSWAGLPDQSRLWEHVRATKIAKDDVTSDVGDAPAAVQGAAKVVRATYDFAIHTHGSLGPSCAVAEIRDGKLTCWTASQATHNLRKQLAQMLGMPLDAVRAIYLEGAGCYGRNGHEDAAGDAALLARATGRPVRVQWSRADEHGWDPKGPPTLIDLRAGLDANGDIVGWESELFVVKGAGGHIPLVAATLAGLPQDDVIAPGNVIHNLALPYTLPNVRTIGHRLDETPFRPSWIRTPGRMQNTYANEAFMDELAATAGADPIAFRLKYLKDPRGAECLERAAKLAGWDPRPSPRKDATGDVVTGRGVTYCKYELNRTYVAAIAEVEVDRRTGAIRNTKFFVAHDCGQIVNPDGLENQIEGNIVQTVSRTLKEELTFDRSMVTSLDWETYPILTFPEVPDVAIDLIDRPSERPWGAGEPAAAIVPSAISNAIFDATGSRLRSVPFTPAKMKAALQAA